MRKIKTYRPPKEEAPIVLFLNSLEPRLAEKIIFQIYRAATLHPSEMKEPHIKHFVLERYREFYEIRGKSKILIRIIFTIRDGDIILLVPFIKRQKRDSEKALEQAVRTLADIRMNPEHVVEFKLPGTIGS